jgi:hypothetical protein
MTIDLMPFCGNEHEIRDWMRFPWVANKWQYATNGHLIVRVPSDEADTEQGDKKLRPNNVADLFKRHLTDGEGEFLLFPPLPPCEPCPVCDGTGIVDEEHGPECCINCWGTKVDFTYRPLGDAGYSLHYLHLLAALPQARIRTDGVKNPAAIIFDGGQALLMPMKFNARQAEGATA